jgi:hypothetical protein
VSIVTVYGYGVTVFGYNRKVEMGRTSELAPLGNGRAVDTSTGEVLDLRERPGMFVYVPDKPRWGRVVYGYSRGVRRSSEG